MADALEGMARGPTDEAASEVIALAVSALGGLSHAGAQGQASSGPLNGAMLLARGVKAERAMEDAAAGPMAGAEAAVLLAAGPRLGNVSSSILSCSSLKPLELSHWLTPKRYVS